MKDEAPQDGRLDEQAAAQDTGRQHHDPVSDYLEPEVDTDALVQGLKNGQLSASQQEALAGMLVEDEPSPQMMAFGQQQTMYSGPLPHAEQFNAYDEHARKVILQMAKDDQDHTHDMQKTGLMGAIEKDKRGQHYGLVIALAGLLAATIIAPFSATAAGIIGSIDLFGMVALFVAPRVLEGRAIKKQPPAATEHSTKDNQKTQ